MRTVFFGSGAFAVPILEGLARRAEVEIVAVVTPPERPAGRAGERTPVPLAVAARRHGLTILPTERVRSAAAIDAIRDLAPDLGILADFGQFIPQAVIDVPAHGILNIHPSLLPRHRGATPIPATILAGDPVAGVTVMQMDAGLDTGPIVAMRSWALAGTEDAPALEARAAGEGSELLDEVITALLEGPLRTTPQDHAAATLTRPLRRSDGRLDPLRTAVELERQVRALRPWPGTFLEVGGRRIVVHEAAVAASPAGDTPGQLVPHRDGIALATARGRLDLRIVQRAGGRPMAGPAFRRGHPALIGVALDAGAVMDGVSSGPRA